MEKKIIFLDIDGTLTESGTNDPPESALQAIAAARRRGNYVFLCSGRCYKLLASLLAHGFDGVIASSGGYIECGGQVIYDSPMPDELRQRAMEALGRQGIVRMLECRDGAYLEEGFEEYLREHAQEGENRQMLLWQEQINANLGVRPLGEYQGQPAYKIVLLGKDREQFARAAEELGDAFEFYLESRPRYGYLEGEAVPYHFDKGNGVIRICRHLGIPLYRSIAIGDGINDRDMIEIAGVGICMQNGSDELKLVADDVCPSVRENGIYYAFLKYHLM